MQACERIGHEVSKVPTGDVMYLVRPTPWEMIVEISKKLSTDVATILQYLVCREQDPVEDRCDGEDASHDGTGATDES